MKSPFLLLMFILGFMPAALRAADYPDESDLSSAVYGKRDEVSSLEIFFTFLNRVFELENKGPEETFNRPTQP